MFRVTRVDPRSHRRIRLSFVATLAIGAALSADPSAALAQAPGNQGLVVRDGTLGHTLGIVPADTDPEGPDYLIDGGLRVGGNLFHSFSQFSIGIGEIATFTAPEGVQIENVVSRVTGDLESRIDGTLQSTIGEENFFLLNPAGVVFGPKSLLDVPGSFFLSTADEIRLDDGEGLFSASDPESSLLTMAAPESFGFLSAVPAEIRLESDLDGDPPFRASLEVAPGRDLNLIGGDLTIDGAVLSALEGTVRLVSLASDGSVTGISDESEPQLEGFTQLGQIRIVNDAIVSASGLSPFPRPKDAGANSPPEDLTAPFFNGPGEMEEKPLAEIVGSPGGGAVPLGDTGLYLLPRQLEEGGGRISIRAEALLVEDSEVRATTPGNGDAGDISVDLDGDLEIRKSAPSEDLTIGIFAGSGEAIRGFAGTARTGNIEVILPLFGNGKSGNISVSARTIRLNNGGQISSTSFGDGEGGIVEVTASETIEVSGRNTDEKRTPSGIFSNAQGTAPAGSIKVEANKLELRGGAGLFAQTTGNANAGDIIVNVNRLEIFDTSQIDSSTSAQSLDEGDPGPTTGNGGNISVTAAESVLISGGQDNTDFARISTRSLEKSIGQAASIIVNTPLLQIDDGGGISARTAGAGLGGNIVLNAGKLLLQNGAQISARSEGKFKGAGDAGSITIGFFDNLILTEVVRLSRSSITTSAPNADGGNINIRARKLVDAYASDITANVGGGTGGNIVIDPTFVTFNHSRILTTAPLGEGSGGNIDISADFFFESESEIDARGGPAGIDGTVVIRAPDVDISGTITSLPETFLDAAELIRERCASRRAKSTGSFVLSGRSGLPPSPDGFLPASHAEPRGQEEVSGVLEYDGTGVTPVSWSPSHSGEGVHDAGEPYAVPDGVAQRLVERVRSGRSPESLAEKYEPSAQTIRN